MNACCGFPRHKSHSIQYFYYLYPFSFLSLSLPLFSLAPSTFPYIFLLSFQTVHFSFSQTTSPLLLLAPYFMLQPSSSNRCNYLIISHCEELEEVVDGQRPTSNFYEHDIVFTLLSSSLLCGIEGRHHLEYVSLRQKLDILFC